MIKLLPILESDKIHGGLADKLSLTDIAKKHNTSVNYIKQQIQQGIKIESEHTDDKSIAFEIAKDHLTEDKDYYKKLKTIE